MWFKTTFQPEKLPEYNLKEPIVVVHNMDQHGMCGIAFAHWYERLGPNNPTSKSFAAYITKKGYRAFTMDQFKQKFPFVKLITQK